MLSQWSNSKLSLTTALSPWKPTRTYLLRRLANYNFTMYDIGKGDGYCYLSHKGLTKGGSNEIAPSLHDFSNSKIARKQRKSSSSQMDVRGQNKNSIIPGMRHHFIVQSISVHKFTLFFEANHSQNEGDLMHSVIERKIKKMGDLFLPSELATLMKVARKTNASYNVT